MDQDAVEINIAFFFILWGEKNHNFLSITWSVF